MGTLASGSIDLNSLQVAGKPNKYITKINDTGITIHPEDTVNNKRNILINSNGISIRNDALPMMELDNDSLDFNVIDTGSGTYTNVASFGASGATIGVTDGTQSYLYQDYHSFQMFDKESHEYFYISDLRDAKGYYTDFFIGNGSQTDFTFTYPTSASTSIIKEVKVDDVVQSTSTYSVPNIYTLRFSSAPTNGANISVTYKPANSLGTFSTNVIWNTKAYTLGCRYLVDSTILNPIGAMSMVEGFENMASGKYSHAEGERTLAKGNWSHTEGYGCKAKHHYTHAGGCGTVADQQYQTAVGVYNTRNNTNNLFVVGNGYGDSDDVRSDAFAVDWDGNIESAGTLTMENHSDPIGWFYPISDTISKLTGTSFASISGSAYTPSAGRYLITASARYSGASSGNRGVCIYQGGSVVDSTQVLVPAIQSSSWSTDLKTIGYFNADGSTEFRIGLLQNSGSSLSTSYTLTFIRIR